MKTTLAALSLFFLAPGLLAQSAPEPVEITGRVLDANGKPAAKVAVELTAAPSAAEARKLQLLGKVAPDPLARTATEADGRFRLAAPGVGMYEVTVRAGDALPATASLFPLQSATELPPLRLEKSNPLRLRVLDAEGRPRSAMVVARPAAQARAVDGWQIASRAGITDAAGTLVIPRRHAELLDVAAVAGGMPEMRAARVSAATAELRAEAVCPRRVSVRDRSGQPVADASVSTEFLLLGVTDADGFAAVAAPCTRELRLFIETADGRGARARLSPQPADQAGALLSVVVDPPERLAGRVVDAETRGPVAGALVWTEDDPAGVVRTDDKGAYVLMRAVRPAEEAGAVQLRAAAGGYQPAAAKPGPKGAAPNFALQPTAALAGVVVDAQGKPVATVDIRVEEWTSESGVRFPKRADGLPARTISRGDGAFRIEVLPRRAYTLRASRPGFAPATLTVADKLAPRAVKSGLRIVLPAGTGAFGTVVEERSSRPVAGSEVRLVPASGRASLPYFLRMEDGDAADEFQVHSDAQGNFRFEHLPGGRFDLFVKADGFTPRVERGIVIESGAPANLGAVKLDRGTTLEGTVVDADDRPLAGATVAVQPPSAAGIRADNRADLVDPEQVRETLTGPDGTFKISGLNRGETVDVSARRPGYVPATLSRVELPASAPVRLEMEPAARVSGRVVTDRGVPVPGATVSARPADAALPAGLSGRVTNADDAGAFVLEDLGGGKIAIDAVAKGFLAGEPRVLELTEGKSVDNVELTLQKGASIEGRVLTPQGTPATAARVMLRQQITPDRMLAIEVAGSVRTDGDGHFRLEGVPLGTQSVSADQEGFLRDVRDLEVRPGENRLDFRLGEGMSVTGRVVDGRGQPLGGASVTLMGTSRGIARDEVSDSSGAFRFSGMAAGSYNVSAQKQGFSTAREAVQLTDRGVDNVELRLDQGGGVVTGRILGVAAHELSQLQITATKRPLDSLDGMREGKADHQGSYRVEGVFPGEWTVTARLPNGRQANKNATVAEGTPQTQVDLEFGAGVTLTGSVRRRGQGVPDASVQATGTSAESFGSTVTDGSGNFRIEGLQAGEHSVVAVVAQSGLRAERSVTLNGSQRLDIELPTARASGQVVDANGMPLAGVTVSAEPATGAPASAFGPRATSESDGSFVLSNLGRGSYRVSGSKDGYARAEIRVEVQSEDASIDNLRLSLEREQGLSLEVASASGVPPSRVGVALLDPAGQPVFSQSVTTGERGVARVTSAPSGSYRLLVGADSTATVSMTVQIPGPTVPVVLPRAARLTVDVPELIGKGAVAAVTVTGGDGQPFRSVSRGAVQQQWPLLNGMTTVEGLASGNWTVVATGPNGQRWQESVTVVEGQDARASLR